MCTRFPSAQATSLQNYSLGPSTQRQSRLWSHEYAALKVDSASRGLLLILAALLFLLLALAALRPLSVPDEGRYADIGRWMLQSGDWMVPRLNGIPFFHKPPLLHWLLAGTMAVFGVSTWAARLVPALSAVLLLVALYCSSRILVNDQVARRAALMLGTSVSFLIGGQFINHDILVAAWISVAIWGFALAMLCGDRPHAGLARLAFIACALGVLAKGLIGVVLPGLVLFAWILWTRHTGFTTPSCTDTRTTRPTFYATPTR